LLLKTSLYCTREIASTGRITNNWQGVQSLLSLKVVFVSFENYSSCLKHSLMNCFFAKVRLYSV